MGIYQVIPKRKRHKRFESIFSFKKGLLMVIMSASESKMNLDQLLLVVHHKTVVQYCRHRVDLHLKEILAIPLSITIQNIKRNKTSKSL